MQHGQNWGSAKLERKYKMDVGILISQDVIKKAMCSSAFAMFSIFAWSIRVYSYVFGEIEEWRVGSIPKTSLFCSLSFITPDHVIYAPRQSCDAQRGETGEQRSNKRTIKNTQASAFLLGIFFNDSKHTPKLSGRTLETRRNKKSCAKNALKSEL